MSEQPKQKTRLEQVTQDFNQLAHQNGIRQFDVYTLERDIHATSKKMRLLADEARRLQAKNPQPTPLISPEPVMTEPPPATPEETSTDSV